MGKCKFCNQHVRFFRTSHPECKTKNEENKKEIETSKRKIISAIARARIKGCNLQQLEHEITTSAKASNINNSTVKKLVIAGWEQAVERAFDDGIFTEEEQTGLTSLMEYFSLTQSQLDHHGAFTKIVKGAILRDIMDGKTPERLAVDGNIPFNFQKTEKLVWIFQNVDYLEQKIKSQYIGASKGVSIRIAKGIYFRTSDFKGERAEAHETIHADTGALGITNKHIYFAGTYKRFRIRFNKILAFEPYTDGIGIQRDATTAKPQTFITGDGWFTYNLITNLAQM